MSSRTGRLRRLRSITCLRLTSARTVAISRAAMIAAKCSSIASRTSNLLEDDLPMHAQLHRPSTIASAMQPAGSRSRQQSGITDRERDRDRRQLFTVRASRSSSSSVRPSGRVELLSNSNVVEVACARGLRRDFEFGVHVLQTSQSDIPTLTKSISRAGLAAYGQVWRMRHCTAEFECPFDKATGTSLSQLPTWSKPTREYIDECTRTEFEAAQTP